MDDRHAYTTAVWGSKEGMYAGAEAHFLIGKCRDGKAVKFPILTERCGNGGTEVCGS